MPLISDILTFKSGNNLVQVESGMPDNSSIKIPGCVCWGSENVPILKAALGKKKIPILKVSSAFFIPILWSNIKVTCIISKGQSQSIIF